MTRTLVHQRGTALLSCLVWCSSEQSLGVWKYAARIMSLVAPIIVGTLLALTFILSLSGCTSQPKKSILLQSPKEILSTALRVYDLNAGTNVNEYAHALGSHFKRALEHTKDPIPFERYILDGSTDKYGVELNIHGLGPARTQNPLKRVEVHMFGLDQIACIRKADIDGLASAGFQILEPLPPPAPQIGYSVIRPDNPHDRIMNVSYAWQIAETCVWGITLDFQPISDRWGH